MRTVAKLSPAVWSDELKKVMIDNLKMQNAPIKGRSANMIILDDPVSMANHSHLTVRRGSGSPLPVSEYATLGWHRWKQFSQGDLGPVSLSLTVQQQSEVEEQTPEEEHKSGVQQGSLKHSPPVSTPIVENGKLICDLI